MTSNQELRAILRGQGGSKAFIVALAKNFPAARQRFSLEPWSAMDLRQESFGSSHGERCVVQFLLRVWNFSNDWDDPKLLGPWLAEKGLTAANLGYDPLQVHLGKFDVIDALGVWDAGNRAAFIEWAKDPIWP